MVDSVKANLAPKFGDNSHKKVGLVDIQPLGGPPTRAPKGQSCVGLAASSLNAVDRVKSQPVPPAKICNTVEGAINWIIHDIYIAKLEAKFLEQGGDPNKLLSSQEKCLKKQKSKLLQSRQLGDLKEQLHYFNMFNGYLASKFGSKVVGVSDGSSEQVMLEKLVRIELLQNELSKRNVNYEEIHWEAHKQAANILFSIYDSARSRQFQGSVPDREPQPTAEPGAAPNWRDVKKRLDSPDFRQLDIAQQKLVYEKILDQFFPLPRHHSIE